MSARRDWHPLAGLAVFCAAGIAWMVAVAFVAVLLTGCTGDDIEPGPDGAPAFDAGTSQLVVDGDYRVWWGEGQPGTWLDCDVLSLRDGALSLDWSLNGSCREAAIAGGFETKVLLETTGCGVYEGDGYAWRLCPGGGALAAQREEDGEVVVAFAAERIR